AGDHALDHRVGDPEDVVALSVEHEVHERLGRRAVPTDGQHVKRAGVAPLAIALPGPGLDNDRLRGSYRARGNGKIWRDVCHRDMRYRVAAARQAAAATTIW